MADAPILRVEHLEVRYGDLVGVADVSLEVADGGIIVLIARFEPGGLVELWQRAAAAASSRRHAA